MAEQNECGISRSRQPSYSSTSRILQDEEEPRPLSMKVKLLTVAAIYYGNVTFGCVSNIYGPTLTSFQKKYETDDESISRVLSLATIGFVVGSLSSGFVYKYVNRQLGVTIILTLMAVSTFLTPFCPSLTTYLILAGVTGIFSGFYGSAQFVWIMEMMQKECPPYVQGQHFFYAFGTILSTLIVAPFLDSDSKPGKNGSRNESLTITKYEGADDPELNELFIPFAIVGSLLLISAIMQLVLFIFFRYRKPPLEAEQSDKREINEANVNAESNPNPVQKFTWGRIRLVILCSCFFGALQGMEGTVLPFIPKFAQNSNLHLSESDSAYILTGLTVAYAVCRFICIFIVFKVSSQLLLCGNLVITSIAATLLTLWASNSLPVMWASSILFGIGFSSAFACFSAYIERYLEITNLIGAIMMLCGPGAAALYPIIVGTFINENPVVLGYVAFFSIIICTVSDVER